MTDETKHEAKPEHKGVASAMLAVMGEVGYVQKTGTVAFGKTKYSFAGEAALIAALRPAMLKHGITVHCANVQIVSNERGLITAICDYVFNHPDSATELRVQAIGQGADSQDKAAYKAMTGAFKYALRQTFVIETGDDPDAESSEEIEQKRREKEAEEAERLLQQNRAKAEKFAERFVQKLAGVAGLQALQSGIDKNRVTLDWIKENFPDVDDELQRELDKAYKRVGDLANA